ncbi:MAG: 2-C-methyl-D-erythritol 4-phosphate cytidylyltransferase [Bacteroidales bacterium]|nr:2-C-methyl-D-erythritol 4-phosphate cytidylyltransferase [Bacteroidales bacterium]
MGTSVPKQFLPLGGRPVLQVSIEKILQGCPSAHIVVVLPAESVGKWKEMCAANNFDCPQTIVEGGFTRYHSVRNALAKIPDGAVVLVHDAVRPMVSADLVRRVAAAMGSARAVVPVVRVQDTIKRLVQDADGGLCRAEEAGAREGWSVLDREELFAAQTPQAFRSEDLKRAYSEAYYSPKLTDDDSVAAQIGVKTAYVEGERGNFKITTPYDYELAKTLF